MHALWDAEKLSDTFGSPMFSFHPTSPGHSEGHAHEPAALEATLTSKSLHLNSNRAGFLHHATQEREHDRTHQHQSNLNQVRILAPQRMPRSQYRSRVEQKKKIAHTGAHQTSTKRERVRGHEHAQARTLPLFEDRTCIGHKLSKKTMTMTNITRSPCRKQCV